MIAMNQKVSLILPTFRRPALLAAALRSIAASEGCSANDVEVIVADNNSGDATRAIVTKAAAFYPFQLHYLLEPRQGVSFARNTGARLATGNFFIFMNDDQQIDRSYLARVLASFAETKADCVGGWTGYVGADDFPSWLRRVVVRVGQRDFGSRIKRIAALDPHLGGGNMIIRRAMFERIGGFRGDIGPSAGATCGEDIEIQDRIIAAGGTIFYDPQLRQNYYLEPERMTRAYYLHRAFQSGRGDYRQHHMAWRSYPQLLGVPRFLWRSVATATAKAVTAVLASPGQFFERLCLMASELGQIREAFHTAAMVKSTNAADPFNW